MEIYAIIRSYQGRDGDDWQHWIQHDIHSYFQHRKDAEDKVQELLKEEIKELLETAERYQDNPDMKAYYDRTHKCYLNNYQEYIVGTKDTEECEIYFIRPITVL